LSHEREAAVARTLQLVGEGADRRRLREAEALLPASTTVNSSRRARALDPHRCPDVMMRSKEGKGSTFVATLPIAAQRIMGSWRHEG